MDIYSATRRLNRPFSFDADTKAGDIPLGAHGLIGDGTTCALVRMDGTRMGVSADISGQLATLGLVGWNLTAGAVCAAGDYYVTLLQNAGTPATLGSCSSQGSSSAANAGLTAATAFHTTGPTAQTSIAASITMASRTLSGQPLWAGVK